SSRRRHTSFSRDWSSDVCSSDLRDAVLTFLYLDFCISKRFPLWQTIRNFAFCFVLQGMIDSELKGRTNFALTSLPTIDEDDNNRSEERRVGKKSMTRT